MGLSTAALTAPAVSLRRSNRLRKNEHIMPPTTLPPKEDIQDTLVSPCPVTLLDKSTNSFLSRSWAFLEHGINGVMVKLEDGVDMKQVHFTIQPFPSSSIYGRC